MPKLVNLASFWKPEDYGQTALPDSSIVVGQKMLENAKFEIFRWDIFGIFQTMYTNSKMDMIKEKFKSDVFVD